MSAQSISPVSQVLASLFLTLFALTDHAHANDGAFDNLAKMVKDGTAKLDLRYRFEGVDQGGFDADAEASTLKTRLTLTTAPLNGFTAQLEFDDSNSIWVNDYNSTRNGKGSYPIIADPEGTDLNQAWIAYKSHGVKAKLGRQRILHGSQRFVGGVAGRQNEQTYDGVRFEAKPIDGLSLDVAFVSNINRIFGPEDGVQPSDWQGDNVFLRSQYTLTKSHSVAGFGYLIDVDAQNDFSAGKTVNNSTSTFGVEYKGKFAQYLELSASWATQSDDGASELDFEADYYMVELGGTVNTIKLRGGIEVLGSGEDKNTGLNVGFKTPLATLHKFQGWSDKFLGTPADGIEDTYVGISGKVGDVKLAAVYHDFQAESSGTKYGTELDLVVTWPVNKYLTLQAKYADYDADELLSDTSKFWLTAQLKL